MLLFPQLAHKPKRKPCFEQRGFTVRCEAELIRVAAYLAPMVALFFARAAAPANDATFVQISGAVRTVPIISSLSCYGDRRVKFLKSFQKILTEQSRGTCDEAAANPRAGDGRFQQL
jgi:hypothetical protein